MPVIESKYIKSPINYNGNKYKLLSQILPFFPNKISTFLDLFGGSGTVSLNTTAEHIIYNDIIPHIGEILDGVKGLNNIDEFIQNTIHKIIYEYKLDKTNLKGFEKIREDYNIFRADSKWYHLYILMCYSFNNQFRFNNKHDYNSSFGKHKSCFSKVTESKLRLAKNKLDEIDICFTNHNFKDFDFSDFDENDFIYLDPPYLNSTGNYNDGKRGFEGWNEILENDLLSLLVELNNKDVRFALSNNLEVNPNLKTWAERNNFKIIHIDGDYSNSNYQKKDKTTKGIEVLIINY